MENQIAFAFLLGTVSYIKSFSNYKKKGIKKLTTYDASGKNINIRNIDKKNNTITFSSKYYTQYDNILLSNSCRLFLSEMISPCKFKYRVVTGEIPIKIEHSVYLPNFAPEVEEFNYLYQNYLSFTIEKQKEIDLLSKKILTKKIKYDLIPELLNKFNNHEK